jgi:AcrR family transcriptional regulator
MAKQQRSEETRFALVQSAAKVFAVTPYDKARVADIIEPLGLTQGAFYFHFGNKRDLALEVIRREHHLIVQMTEKVQETAPDGLSGSRLLGQELAKLVRKDRLVQAGLRLTSQTPDEFPEFVGTSTRVWQDALTRFLQDAQHQGTVRSNVSVDAASRFVVATFLGVQEMSAITTKWRDLEERMAESGVLALHAIATERGVEGLAEEVRAGALGA